MKSQMKWLPHDSVRIRMIISQQTKLLTYKPSEPDSNSESGVHYKLRHMKVMTNLATIKVFECAVSKN